MNDYRCLSGKQCVSRTSGGAAVTMKPEALCNGCVVDIQRCLDELPAYRDALRTFLGSSPKSALQSKVSMTSGPSSPYNANVADLIDQVGETLSRTGGLVVRDLVSRPSERFSTWYGGVVFLSGVERALAVRRVHGKADAVVGLGRVWERRRAACRECGLPTLGNWSGEDTIFCTNSECGASLSKSDYEAYCEVSSRTR